MGHVSVREGGYERSVRRTIGDLGRDICEAWRSQANSLMLMPNK